MILRHLALTNFKNISDAALDFSPKINCLIGDNGMGKSNLLDAVYYLSFCKSFTGAPDSMLLRRGQEFMMISADYRRRDIDENLSVGFRPGHRKTFRRSGKEYRRLSEHIGLFPLVIISPADMDLINGPAEERRRFLDIVISQTDAAYLDHLIRYNRALEQRNRMLRDSLSDPILYQAVEAAMDASARYICDVRRTKIAEISAIFDRYYRLIAGTDEHPTLTYTSHLADPTATLTALFDQRRARDLAVGYTTAGPHRDDIEMQLHDLPVRRCASQGQSKTYTIALRLAQFEFLRHATGLTPLLLLDDIFDKLDSTRVARIIDLVSDSGFGQIFITDTNRKHIDEIIAAIPGDSRIYDVTDGKFTPL